MGANESAARNVSFGMDGDEKVTVIEGVKLSPDVLRRMKGSHATKQPAGSPANLEPKARAHPQGPTTTEIQEEIRKNFERQQALVQEQLDKLAQREREAVATAGLTDPIIAKAKNYEDGEKVKLLPADLDAWARQLERKEEELARISSFYKDQLAIMERKNIDNYKEAVQQYDQTAARAETHMRPLQTEPVCPELQAKVLQCYKDHPEQTLLCSTLAKEYMGCVQRARKNLLTTHS
ncbi:MICOS complex subunit mic25a-like isoform X3 [Synchiropus splendidus]|uniref:MICOS complex subunit mic25a-like isoform X3 n=1 Tax=Synchiropus splendidus TaxID=270530 RepID=UPI00237DB442|nr:MICOS complex subunit mic25a-like isoform X3 [Synchiropus splendidus]